MSEETPHAILKDLAQAEVKRLYPLIADLEADLDEAHGRASLLTEELQQAKKRYATLVAYVKETT